MSACICKLCCDLGGYFRIWICLFKGSFWTYILASLSIVSTHGFTTSTIKTRPLDHHSVSRFSDVSDALLAFSSSVCYCCQCHVGMAHLVSEAMSPAQFSTVSTSCVLACLRYGLCLQFTLLFPEINKQRRQRTSVSACARVLMQTNGIHPFKQSPNQPSTKPFLIQGATERTSSFVVLRSYNN